MARQWHIPEGFMSPAQFAEKVGIPYLTIHRWIKMGLLPHERPSPRKILLSWDVASQVPLVKERLKKTGMLDIIEPPPDEDLEEAPPPPVFKPQHRPQDMEPAYIQDPQQPRGIFNEIPSHWLAPSRTEKQQAVQELFKMGMGGSGAMKVEWDLEEPPAPPAASFATKVVVEAMRPAEPLPPPDDTPDPALAARARESLASQYVKRARRLEEAKRYQAARELLWMAVEAMGLEVEK